MTATAELPSESEGFAIDIVVDEATGKVACVYTVGLRTLDLPEFYVLAHSDPPDLEGPDDASQVALLYGQAMIGLGSELINTRDPADVGPQRFTFGGRSARFAVQREKKPAGELRLQLGRQVRSVCEVTASDWRREG